MPAAGKEEKRTEKKRKRTKGSSCNNNLERAFLRFRRIKSDRANFWMLHESDRVIERFGVGTVASTYL